MRGTVLYGPGDIRFEDRETPRIEAPTDAVIRIAATCVCGSDLWPYRGLQPLKGPTPMGHEYCGFVEEVGAAVRSVKPGQFVVGSFATSDNVCPNCQYGYQSSCMHREGARGGARNPRRGRSAGVSAWSWFPSGDYIPISCLLAACVPSPRFPVVRDPLLRSPRESGRFLHAGFREPDRASLKKGKLMASRALIAGVTGIVG